MLHESKNLEFDIFNENELMEIVIPLTPQKKMPSFQVCKNENIMKIKTKSTLSIENYSLMSPLRIKTSNLKQSEILQRSIYLNLLQGFKIASDAVAKHELECLIVKYLNKQEEKQMKQYLLTMDWATKYIAYLYEDSRIRPTAIDNCSLMQDENMFLIQEVFVVNDMLWYFLVQEYQGGPEILLDQYAKRMRGRYKTHSFQSIECMMMRRNVDSSSSSNFILLSSKKKKMSFEIPLVGLKNDSNYCYMHSGLQSLLCIQELNYLLLAKIQPQLYQDDSTSRLLQSQLQITIKYLELIEQMRNKESEHMRIGDLRRQISKKFNPKMQHDCQEFLLYLLSTMQDELSALAVEADKISIKQKYMENNIIDQIFKGQIESRVRCSSRECNNTTSCFEPFLSLSLALNRNKDLRQCLDEFFHEETIKDYRCEKCHQQVMGQKRMYLAQMPRNIIFHLKRFKLFPNQQKLSHFIQFPFDGLDLNDFQGKGRSVKPNYRLRAVVVHEGGLTGGHYYSFGRRFHNWFKFNDEEITRVSSRDIIHEQAYLLIYSHLNG